MNLFHPPSALATKRIWSPVRPGSVRAESGRAIRAALPLFMIASTAADASPNLMAIGDYTEIPFARAEGRASVAGGEAVFSFDDPRFDFGRVVARSKVPLSVLRRDLFVGFTGEGLVVSLRSPGQSSSQVRVDELEIWLRVRGQLRPGVYEWEFDGGGEAEMRNGLEAAIPILWADGDQRGARVTITTPPPDAEAIRRMVVPTGQVRIEPFERQTGAAWVVLLPEAFGHTFTVRRFSFREVAPHERYKSAIDMPTPVRYIPIRSRLQGRVESTTNAARRAILAERETNGSWSVGAGVNDIVATAWAALAVAPGTETPEIVDEACQWLARREFDPKDPWPTTDTAARLYAMSRLAPMDRYRQVIHTDIEALVDAQLDDGGWAATRGNLELGLGNTATSDHHHSFLAMRALREAGLAGADVDERMLRSAMQYWTDSQALHGGYRSRLQRYGVSGASTVTFTAIGASSMLAALDLASSVGRSRCTTFLASSNQLNAVDAARDWLAEGRGGEFSDVASLRAGSDPYLRTQALRMFSEATGITDIAGQTIFEDAASDLLDQFDEPRSLFGLRGPAGWDEDPGVLRSAQAVATLAAWSAPTVLQRTVVGDREKNWREYSGDMQHAARFLSLSRSRILNWRRASIDDDTQRLAEVPILVVHVVGPFEWTDAQWRSLRDYCLSGGIALLDIAEGADDARSIVESGLRTAFPEYRLSEVAGTDPLFSVRHAVARTKLQSVSNDFRHFALVTHEPVSCALQRYSLRRDKDEFELIDNLLSYITDDTELRSSFAASPVVEGARPTHSLSAFRLEVGGDVPAWPGLLDQFDAILRATYRTQVGAASAMASADLIWITVAGERRLTDGEKRDVKRAIDSNAFLLVDVAAGHEGAAEMFRATIRSIDNSVSVTHLHRDHAMFTGRIEGTTGYDLTQASLRPALHNRLGPQGQCDLDGILVGSEFRGVFSSFDLASGLGHHLFPGCKGPMPESARRFAIHAGLLALKGEKE